jgi:hypothetical protein
MRIYTLEEARAVLPAIIPILERIRLATHRMRELQGNIARATAKSATNGHLPEEPGSAEDIRETLSNELSAAVAELQDYEVELKDPERGLIDFYHERDGELVYLCFMLGEVDIAAWHPIDTGFAGRQPL